MNKLLVVWIQLCCLLVISACHPLSVTTNTPQASKKPVKFLLNQLDKQQLQYQWFGCRTKVKVDSEKEDVVFSANLRMRKDSLIWVSIKKMSVEGARIKITPQSIEILNRQESQYIKRPYSFIKQEYGLDISFSQLQEAILGNPILYRDRTFLSGVENNQLVLQTPPNQKEVLKLFMRAGDFLLEEWRGSIEGSSLTIDYSNYESIQDQTMATKKIVHIDSEAVGVVDIDLIFSGIVLDEVQKVSFVIPSSYERL